MPIEPHEVELVGDVTWAEVVEVWRAREEEHWRPHYEARGFDTWLAWRMHYMQQFSPDTRTWRLYRVRNTTHTVPKFLVGAFQGWRQYYPAGTQVATFADLAKSPLLLKNMTVQRLVQGMPAQRQIMVARQGNQWVVRDGTHHCAATALMAQYHMPAVTQTVVAVMEFGEDESDLFTRTYHQQFAPAPLAPKG